jgi:ribose/xylose/arabinose/galactoside ABC-type transport system permease subunit
MKTFFFRRHFKILCLLALFVLFVLIVYIVNHAFIKAAVVRNILLQMAPSGVAMVGMSCLLMSGSIDLSSDSQGLIGIVVFAFACQAFPGIPWPILMLISVAVVVCCGLVHSFLCNKLGFMPFIATIAMSSVYSGLVTAWTQTQQVMITRPSFSKLATVAVLGGYVPLHAIIMIVIIAGYGVMLSNTRFGRSIYMCGGNRMAARLSGLNPAKISTVLFINNGILALTAGLMWAAQKKMASRTYASSAPSMSGMTAAILGGVSFMGGGAGGMTGAFVGLLLLRAFTSGLNYIPGLSGQQWTWLNVTLQGMILVIALIIDNYNSRRVARQLLAARKAEISGKSAA